MLRLFAKDLNGEIKELSNLQSVVLESEENVAGDSLVAEISEAVFDEMVSVVLRDDEEIIFEGMVDEQNVNISNKELTELVCRSFGALLIDNEAAPQSFVNPDMNLIFERYIKPFGIEKFVGENKACLGEFKVQKGMSCYKVLEEFCLRVYAAYPRIEGRTLILSAKKDGLLFSNRRGIHFDTLKYSKLRAVPISLIRAKTEEAGGYDTLLRNSLAQLRGICRERYFNATLSSGKNLKTAYEALSLSNSRDEFVTLTVPGRVVSFPGQRVTLEAEGFPKDMKLFVSSIRYSFSGKFESTRLVLKKENVYVDNKIYI